MYHAAIDDDGKIKGVPDTVNPSAIVARQLDHSQAYVKVLEDRLQVASDNRRQLIFDIEATVATRNHYKSKLDDIVNNRNAAHRVAIENLEAKHSNELQQLQLKQQQALRVAQNRTGRKARPVTPTTRDLAATIKFRDTQLATLTTQSVALLRDADRHMDSRTRNLRYQATLEASLRQQLDANTEADIKHQCDMQYVKALHSSMWGQAVKLCPNLSAIRAEEPCPAWLAQRRSA